MSKPKAVKWLIEFTVPRQWAEEGFKFDRQMLHMMIWAVGTDKLKARLIKKPK